METWGADLYGNPCRDCGFGWDLSPEAAVASVRAMPDAYAERLAGSTGQERHPDLGWTTAGYVSHVADNLRTWSERLAGGYLDGALAVPGYDPDLLSRARHYDELSLAGALWSLRWAMHAWVDSLQLALAAEVVLQHASRGPQRAEDVARNNAHDAHHHLWDVDRILKAS
jgi:hypothetical protein